MCSAFVLHITHMQQSAQTLEIGSIWSDLVLLVTGVCTVTPILKAQCSAVASERITSFPAYLWSSALVLCSAKSWSHPCGCLNCRQGASANSGSVFRGRYLIVSFCLPPRDDSCQSLKDGVKFHECLLLCDKFSSGNSSFLHCPDTVVVEFAERNVQFLISQGALLISFYLISV